MHAHCFILRSEGRTGLFDAGIGPRDAPAFGWAGIEGQMPEALAEAGVGAAHVDDVLISHVHDDHLGWLVAPELGPRFQNARHVLHRADWEAIQNGDPEDVEIFERTLRPLERHGVLQLIDGPLDVTPSLRLEPAPGHTPGHQVLLVEDGAILSADTTNHPALVEEASWSGTTDADPDLAARTRSRLLEDSEREGRLWITSHFAGPFGRVVTRDGRRTWKAV